MGPTRMRLSKPVIAAISGYAVAGGLELALWCDLRVAESDAVLGVFCRRWGVPLIDGGTVRLPRLIGESRAMDLILTGRPVPADEAYAMGLVNRLVAPGQARAAAEGLAAEIAGVPADLPAQRPGVRCWPAPGRARSRRRWRPSWPTGLRVPAGTGRRGHAAPAGSPPAAGRHGRTGRPG